MQITVNGETSELEKIEADMKGNAEQLASELDAKEIEGLRLRVTAVSANKVTVRIVQPEEGSQSGQSEGGK